MAEVPDPKPTRSTEESRKEITCTICHGHYRDPKVLPCLHYFCAECLQQLAASDGQPMPCPKCRQEASFSRDDVGSLLTPLFVNRKVDLHERVEKVEGRAEALCELCTDRGKAEAFCRQCAHFICGGCMDIHEKLANTTFRDHAMVPMELLKLGGARDVVTFESTPAPRKCPQHDKPFKMFCFTCDHLVCRDCMTGHDRHTDHKIRSSRRAGSKCQHKLRTSIAPIQKGCAEISSAVETVKKRKREIIEHHFCMEEKLCRSFCKYSKILKERQAQLLHETITLTERKLAALNAQQKDLAQSLAKAQTVVDFVEQSLEKATNEEVMVMHQQISSSVKKGSENLLQRQTNFEPAAQNNVCITLPELDTDSLGHVYIDPKQNLVECTVHVEVRGMKKAEINVPVEFFLYLADSHGHPVKDPFVIEVRIRSLDNGSIFQATLTPAGNGKHKVMYTPCNRGRHSFSVKHNGREMEGSPFLGFVCFPPSLMDQLVKGINSVRDAYGISINNSGEVIVVSGWGRRGNKKNAGFANSCWQRGGEVNMFNKEGDKVNTIQCDYVMNPCGIATDPNGHIYVSCCSPPTALKFSPDGKTLLSLTKVKSKGDYLGMIRIIDGQLFVCSESDCAVIVLDCEDLQEISRFGRKGTKYGEFDYPIDVLAEKGELYVSDFRNNRIQVFNDSKIFVRRFSVKDPVTQSRYSPRGLCVSPDGLLYIACFYPDRIFAFTLEGECVTSIDVNSVEGWPAGIAADPDGYLYVCMEGSDSIAVF